MRGLKRAWLKGVTRAVVLSALIATAAAPGAASAVTLNKLTSSTPALAVFNGKLFLAFRGMEGRLNVASSTDGLTFGSNTVLNNYTAFGPGLAPFGGSLYIAWAGTDDAHRINYMSSTDGVTWGTKTLFGNEASYGSPALAGSSNQLLIAWNGTDSAHNINIACIVCTALNYGTKNIYSPGTQHGVGLAAIDDNFFLAVRRNSAATILSSPAANPLTLTEQVSVGTSAVGPGIAGSSGFAYVGWVGSGNALNFGTFQLAGTSVALLSQSLTPAGHTSQDKPALAVFNGHVYYAWKGTDGYINIEQVQ